MKKGLKIILILIVTLVICVIGMLIWYNAQLGSVNKGNNGENLIEIKPKTSTDNILGILKEEGIIKNKLAAKIYMKLNGVRSLQAGKYSLNSSMTLEEVLNQISSGNVKDESVTITFLEGKNMRWFAKKIEEKTNNKEEEVYLTLEDSEYIDSLIQKYWFLTDDIKRDGIYYPLEGYLYPDTYTFENADVSVKEIFEVLLKQTEEVLAEYKEQIMNKKASVHQVLTLASVIELEGKDEESRKGIASVMFNRLKAKMSLGSDVTTYYAIKVDMNERNLTKNDINTYNPYNTRGPEMSGRLPIGPISSISKESINAVLNPIKSNYLYFVADLNGKIYFTSTYDEHQQLVNNLKKQGLWYEY